MSYILCADICAQDVPQVTVFLPNPPKAESDLFICDNYLYTYGKELRTSDRGTQAKIDMVWSLDDYMPLYADVMGITVSAFKASNIYQLLSYGDRYGQLAIKAAVMSYNRERPYVYFNEPSLLPELDELHSDESSYPAYQSCLGWLYALLLAEVCPDIMNDILKRGEAFGSSAVISGFSFDSDAYAGYLLGSAILSRLHTHSGFDDLLAYAQADYKRLTKASTRFDDTPYFSYEELPNSVIYLPEPPTASVPLKMSSILPTISAAFTPKCSVSPSTQLSHLPSTSSSAVYIPSATLPPRWLKATICGSVLTSR